VTRPAPLRDHAVGPVCEPGKPVELDTKVTRLTAPNPSMMTGPGTNAYVVGTDEVVVIDPGPAIDEHLDALRGVIAGRRVAAVAVTHHHRDHAPAARLLADDVGAPVVGHGHDLFTVDVALVEGDELSAGAEALVAWHTPGHASDHLCYFAPGSGMLFTGDHVMQGSTVVIRPPDGDLGAYLDSLERIRSAAEVLRIAPGHGRVLESPDVVIAEILEHRRARGAVVLDALREHGPGTAAKLRPFAYADVGSDRDAVATATCWAHLLAFVDDGTASTSSGRDDPDATFAATS
jgi:glyoxylase-like metal-dependent hydrolase (beta-lactamase superfamily II)